MRTADNKKTLGRSLIEKAERKSVSEPVYKKAVAMPRANCTKNSRFTKPASWGLILRRGSSLLRFIAGMVIEKLLLFFNSAEAGLDFFSHDKF